MSLADPFLVAFTKVFEALGVPYDLAFLLTTLMLIFILFMIFLNIINSFDVGAGSNPYFLVIFFVGICVLGFVPMWILFVIVIVGAIYMLFAHLIGASD